MHTEKTVAWKSHMGDGLVLTINVHTKIGYGGLRGSSKQELLMTVFAVYAYRCLPLVT